MNFSFDNLSSNSMSNFENDNDQAIYYTSDFDGGLMCDDHDTEMEVTFSKPSSIAVESMRSNTLNNNEIYLLQNDQKVTLNQNNNFRSMKATALMLQQYFANNNGYRFELNEEKQEWTVTFISGAQYYVFRLWLVGSEQGECQVAKTCLEGNQEGFNHVSDEILSSLGSSGSLLFDDSMDNGAISNYEFYNQEENMCLIDCQIQNLISEAMFSAPWMEALQAICDLCADQTLFGILQGRGVTQVLSNLLPALLEQKTASLGSVTQSAYRQVLCCVLLALANMSVHMTSLLDMIYCESLIPALKSLQMPPNGDDKVQNLLSLHVNTCRESIFREMRSLFNNNHPLAAKHAAILSMLTSTAAEASASLLTDASGVGRKRSGSNAKTNAPSVQREVSARGEFKNLLSMHSAQSRTGLSMT